MDTGLNTQELLKIKKVFSKFENVEKVILYGSRATGRYKVYSDIDLAIKGEVLTTEQIYLIEQQLDDLLLPYKIDLLELNTITNKDLKEQINKTGVLFYSRD